MEAQERNFAWVARHSGLSPATVARLLRAERAMSVEQFVDMAGALGIEPSKAINHFVPDLGVGRFGDLGECVVWRVRGCGVSGARAVS